MTDREWFARALGLGEGEEVPDGELRVPGPEHVRELYFRLLGMGMPMVEPLAAGGRRVAFACRDPEGRTVRVVWQGEPSL